MTSPNLQQIEQLTSTYGPDQPPRLPLDFGDYLSLLWRLDHAGERTGRADYYRQCSEALAKGLGFYGSSLERLVRITPVGEIYASLGNAPYRKTEHLVDARDRRAAIEQLAALRDNVLTIGTYKEKWELGWPGSGIADLELRERVFAVLNTALRGQFLHFSRILLVIDIVLQELLLGSRTPKEVTLRELIEEYGYPDPESPETRRMYEG